MTARQALVLVAVEDPARAAAMRCELVELACRVVVAHDIVHAVSELHGVEFDVAFLENSLLSRSEIDVLAGVRALAPDTEVVVALDDGRDDAPLGLLRQGVLDFVRHPPPRGELGAVLERALVRRQLRTSNGIFAASQAILDGVTAVELPRVIVELAQGGLSCDCAAFFRVDPSGQIAIAEERGIPSAAVRSQLAEIVDRECRSPSGPQLLPSELRLGEDVRISGGIRSVLTYPLVLDERLVGILACVRTEEPRPFLRPDADRLSVFAAQLRLALDNERLLERTVASERLAAIGELAAGVAHEISNPLTYVVQNAIYASEELRRPGPLQRDELIAMIDDVRHGAERIREIANDLRTMSRSEELTELFDVGDAVRSALRIAKPATSGKLEVTSSLSPKALVRGSPGRVSQVFINLLVNAAQAAAATCSIVPLDIGITRRDGRVIATVTDGGPGIAPLHLPRLFEPSFTTKTASGGTGLGLAITRSIVEEHGGTIRVSSELGRGTSFVVELPAAA